MEIYRQRRKSFQKQMEPGSLALFFNGSAPIRSADSHYRFRPNSDFHYLTGFVEEGSVLTLTPDEAQMYLPDRDPKRELWDGKRLGVDRAVEVLGVDKATDIRKFEEELESLFKNRSLLYHAFGGDADRDRMLFGRLSTLFSRKRAGEFGPMSVTHPAVILHELRAVKAPDEIDALRESCAITREAHLSVMRHLRPGMFEYELEAVLLREFTRQGAAEAYPSIVASGENACVLHYITNNARVGESDLLLVDAGAEKNFMASDVTRTTPASGRFTPAQRDVYTAVLDAQKNAIKGTVAGSSMQKVNEGAARDRAPQEILSAQHRTLAGHGCARCRRLLRQGREAPPHEGRHGMHGRARALFSPG